MARIRKLVVGITLFFLLLSQTVWADSFSVELTKLSVTHREDASVEGTVYRLYRIQPERMTTQEQEAAAAALSGKTQAELDQAYSTVILSAETDAHGFVSIPLPSSGMYYVREAEGQEAVLVQGTEYRSAPLLLWVEGRQSAYAKPMTISKPKEEPSGSDEPPENKEKHDAPKTGDAGRTLWLMGLLLAAGAFSFQRKFE